MLRIVQLSVVAAMPGASASALPAAYTDRAAFEAAVAGISGVVQVDEGYEGLAGGDVIANGGVVGGLTHFPTSDSGSRSGLKGIGSTDGSNSVGWTDGGGTDVGALGFVDMVDFTFGPSFAFGLDIVLDPGFDRFANEVPLTVAGPTSGNAAGTRTPGGVDHDFLFLGVIDAAARFGAARPSFDSDSAKAAAEFDLVSIAPPVVGPATPNAVPLPAGGPLVLAALAALGLRARRRRG